VTTESLLDDAIIAEMRDMLGDDTYRGFVLRMLDEVVDLQPVLESILATQDYELLARTAHKTAGSVVSVGAKGLHALLKQIEDMARQPEQQVRLPILVSLLPARLEETRSHLGLTIGAL
jgi:HPt (histidine-containing phosphotransfer) domain-containing protein